MNVLRTLLWWRRHTTIAPPEPEIHNSPVDQDDEGFWVHDERGERVFKHPHFTEKPHWRNMAYRKDGTFAFGDMAFASEDEARAHAMKADIILGDRHSQGISDVHITTIGYPVLWADYSHTVQVQIATSAWL